MDIVYSIAEVREKISEARTRGLGVGFVPTMGFLHEGHLSLVRESQKHTAYQVMSIFVNRMQFNDPKDFDAYPIDLERDFKLASEAGVDLVFVPDEKEIYRDRKTYIDMELFTDHLCGSARPGHFRGVFTVVGKLFNIIQPDVSVFGQKDIQQAVSIEKMVFDLNFPVKIIISPTVREEGGLAMSSRNKHLKETERKSALVIYRSLQKAEEMLKTGERRWDTIRSEMEKIIASGCPRSIDYITAVSYADLQPAGTLADRSVIAIASFFGATRLIDNMIVELKGDGVTCIY